MTVRFPIFLAAFAVAAATGWLFPTGDWYDALEKPWFTPPDWAFGVVWTYLYLSVAWAAARVSDHPGSQTALALFALQLALNTFWTPVFFGAHRLGAAFVVLVMLWLAVAAMGWLFARQDRLAGALVIPYLAWLTLAGALNWRIWQDNPGAGL